MVHAVKWLGETCELDDDVSLTDLSSAGSDSDDVTSSTATHSK
jgi:hypothetical protein